jgi:hypothetical protein
MEANNGFERLKANELFSYHRIPTPLAAIRALHIFIKHDMRS